MLGYAWGLRALRNTAKMKQAAEHRGKAPIHNTIISQQSYVERRLSKKKTKRKKKTTFKLLRPTEYKEDTIIDAL